MLLDLYTYILRDRITFLMKFETFIWLEAIQIFKRERERERGSKF